MSGVSAPNAGLSMADLNRPEIQRILCGSGFFNARSFWKFSSLVSKSFHPLTKDSTSFGLGGAVAALDLLSDRRALELLTISCIEADDAETLQTLNSAAHVFDRLPGLYFTALHSGSAKAIVLLGQAGRADMHSDLSLSAIERMSVETLTLLLDRGRINPNQWIESRLFEASHEPPQPPPVHLTYWKPLLSVAIQYEKWECVDLLLSRGARVDLCECGETWEEEEKVDRLRVEKFKEGEPDRRTHPHWVTFGDKEESFSRGRTPLHMLVLMISKQKWDPEPVENPPDDASASEVAAFISRVERTRTERYKRCMSLLQRVVEAARESKSLDWTLRWHLKGIEGFEEAAESENESFEVQRLIQTSALGIACYFQEKEVIEVLLDAGARVNWSDCDLKGRGGRVEPPLIVSVNDMVAERADGTEEENQMRVDIVKRLLEAGALLSQVGTERSTALGLACRFNMRQLVHFLMESGAPVRQVRGGLRGVETPFVGAVSPGRMDLALELVSRGAGVTELSLMPSHYTHQDRTSDPLFCRPIEAVVRSLTLDEVARFRSQNLDFRRKGLDLLTKLIDGGARCTFQLPLQSGHDSEGDGGVAAVPSRGITMSHISRLSPLLTACYGGDREAVRMLMEWVLGTPQMPVITSAGMRPLEAVLRRWELFSSSWQFYGDSPLQPWYFRVNLYRAGPAIKIGRLLRETDGQILKLWQIWKDLIKMGADTELLKAQAGCSTEYTEAENSYEEKKAALGRFDEKLTQGVPLYSHAGRVEMQEAGRRHYFFCSEKLRPWLPHLIRLVFHIPAGPERDADVAFLMQLLRALPLKTLNFRGAGTLQMTPLMMACHLRWLEVVQTLLDRGVDVNDRVKNLDGPRIPHSPRSALTAALRKSPHGDSPGWDIVEALLKKNVDLRADGAEAVCHAVKGENYGWTARLIQAKANLHRYVATDRLFPPAAAAASASGAPPFSAESPVAASSDAAVPAGSAPPSPPGDAAAAAFVSATALQSVGGGGGGEPSVAEGGNLSSLSMPDDGGAEQRETPRQFALRRWGRRRKGTREFFQHSAAIQKMADFLRQTAYPPFVQIGTRPTHGQQLGVQEGSGNPSAPPPSLADSTVTVPSAHPANPAVPSAHPANPAVPSAHPANPAVPSAHPVNPAVPSANPAVPSAHPVNPAIPSAHPANPAVPSAHPANPAVPSAHPANPDVLSAHLANRAWLSRHPQAAPTSSGLPVPHQPACGDEGATARKLIYELDAKIRAGDNDAVGLVQKVILAFFVISEEDQMCENPSEWLFEHGSENSNASVCAFQREVAGDCFGSSRSSDAGSMGEEPEELLFDEDDVSVWEENPFDEGGPAWEMQNALMNALEADENNL
uniref:Uncharacterized protein n=1 Tax=Chromera velia CCMP2878 TaxID=1169474 RepID=A0A0G4GRM9_9ALVE|eukprot:Cvel_5101.t1-p1 / transcript=Cvel_5101.t1 / gene=Cvel_5101 / organism=Chromera_velia_CCMP2878 / gene_product=hypothetical protein / transcript_product=hypothetical protein / location=Cvel_scaffold233:46645-51344(-) / protein_length=1359 / sequence_SO=supercontig / SO=protein_coding / is_pseudo=false